MNQKETTQISDSNDPGNYMALGLCFGAAAGVIAMSICISRGEVTLGAVCIPIGAVFGMTLGFCIKKKNPSHP